MNHDYEALASDVSTILRRLASYKEKTFAMQINPMIHTMRILGQLGGAFQAVLDLLPTLKNREEESYLFAEETERAIFDSVSTVVGYLRFSTEDDHVNRRNDYVRYKASLPQRDLEDLYGVIHVTSAMLDELGERVSDDNEN